MNSWIRERRKSFRVSMISNTTDLTPFVEESEPDDEKSNPHTLIISMNESRTQIDHPDTNISQVNHPDTNISKRRKTNPKDLMMDTAVDESNKITIKLHTKNSTIEFNTVPQINLELFLAHVSNLTLLATSEKGIKYFSNDTMVNILDQEDLSSIFQDSLLSQTTCHIYAI